MSGLFLRALFGRGAERKRTKNEEVREYKAKGGFSPCKCCDMAHQHRLVLAVSVSAVQQATGISTTRPHRTVYFVCFPDSDCPLVFVSASYSRPFPEHSFLGFACFTLLYSVFSFFTLSFTLFCRLPTSTQVDTKS